MALFLSEKTDVVRHLGYEMQGLYQTSAAGGSLAYGNTGYRYFKAYGQLLYKLNQMAPDEECRLIGRAYGSVGFSGNTAQPGNTVTITLSGGGLVSPISKTTTVPSTPGYSLVNVCGALAQLFSMDAAFLNAGFNAVADYGSQPFTQSSVRLPIVSFIGPSGQNSFVITIAYTGITAPQILSNGVKLPPYLNLRQQGVVNTIYGYLPILDFLEAQYLGSTGQMSVLKTGNVEFRANEDEQRMDQYNLYRKKLATWLGCPVARDGDASNVMEVVI